MKNIDTKQNTSKKRYFYMKIDKPSIWRHLASPFKIAVILLTIFSITVPAGVYLGTTLTEIKYEKKISQLIISGDSLKSLVMADSLGKRNWITSHSNDLRFSRLDPDIPIITVTNPRLRPCSGGGVDNCWQKNITAFPGDTIIVQISCRNYTDIDNVLVNAGFSATIAKSKKSIIIKGGIKNKNIYLAEDVASISISGEKGFTIIPQAKVYYSPTEYYDQKLIFKKNTPSAGIFFNINAREQLLPHFYLVINK